MFMYNLERFINAQMGNVHFPSYAQALSEIKAGCKKSHWIWYVFPQLRGLATSSRSSFFGIESLAEANAYMQNDLLRARLIEISEALLSLPTENPYSVFKDVDSLKVKSCMTLFSKTENASPVFHKVLEKYYDGKEDETTLALLAKQ